MTIGPLQLLAMGFVDPQLDGSILGALSSLRLTRASDIAVRDLVNQSYVARTPRLVEPRFERSVQSQQ